MKVFDLCCEAEHRFEGWFASEAAFQAQCQAQLIRCPVCDATAVRRLPSAPRLNLGARAPARPSQDAATGPAAVTAPQAAQAALWQAVRTVLANTEDVGTRFAEEARRIHYDEAPARAIRGVATPAEAAELAEEGVDIMPLPVPAAFKQTLQ